MNLSKFLLYVIHIGFAILVKLVDFLIDGLYQDIKGECASIGNVPLLENYG